MASSSSSSSSVTAMIALLVMAVAVTTAQAQATCASKLVPCGAYLNATTKPPSSCCDPIKDAVANDLQCLCNLYENPDFLSGLRINATQALRLPQLCGIPSNDSACNNASAPTGSTPTGSSTQPPPAGAGKIASTGVVGLFLVSACMMLF